MTELSSHVILKVLPIEDYKKTFPSVPIRFIRRGPREH
jgi:hypothetical protein